MGARDDLAGAVMTPEQRIDDLELRLYKYHEWMKESIERRDRLAMDAAWGVHYSFFSTLALIGAYIITDKFLGLHSWITAALFGFALLPIQFVVYMWSNGLRMKEVDSLAKLPDWEWGG
ncbi:hypothetical protein JMG10_34260 [Nostoc ellipsosporum NOK]|nr:hypothetical protein [Nostoc ellipsosporum NOK]